MVTAVQPATGHDDPRDARFRREIWTRLLDATQRMSDTDAERGKLRAALTQVQRHLRDRSDELAADVAADVSCTNDAKRRAALAMLLRTDRDARALQRELEVIEVEAAERDAAFDAARRQRQNLLALLDFSGRWLAYWAANENQNETENDR
jgi:hypothetical protein